MIDVDFAYELLKVVVFEVFYTTLPVLVIAMVVGITVSVLQTVTSIQEQTLSFVPKLFATGLVIYFLGPYILHRLGNMTIDFFMRAGDVLK